MKTKIKTAIAASALIFSLISNVSFAQETKPEKKTTISIETDPSTFAFKGYAFHFRIKPKNSKHLVIGAGTYALDFPSFMVNMNKENKEKGWKVRIKSAYSLFSEYYFKEANKKWFIGLQAGIQNYKNSNDSIPNKKSEYSNLLVMPSIGYNWSPFKFPLYIKPWLGLGYTNKISGNNQIDNLKYSISPLVPFLTLHVGYTFGD
ncbi:MAG: hypothetical protein SFY56_13675 [Bacteroidota bacterium]|nr:hypothetical protein [Bacteroidota bacterium]